MARSRLNFTFISFAIPLCLSVRLFVCNNSCTTEQDFIKFDTTVFTKCWLDSD
jgi:hypothetical protein